jgi:hypothetical protein
MKENQVKPLQTKEVSKEKNQNLPKENPNITTVSKEKTEALTIKTEKEAKEYFLQTAKNLGLTQQQMFSILTEVYQKFDGLEQEFNNMVNSLEQKEIELASITAELETEKANIKNVEVQVEKLVPVALTGTQFICELPEATAKNVRKCRPFMLKDGIIREGNPNEIVSVSVEYFLRHKYDHVLDPVFRNKF